MRTKTVTITEYTIDELDGDHLQKALHYRRDWMHKHEDFWWLTHDAMEAIKRGLEWLGYDLNDWSIDFESGHVHKLRISMDGEPDGDKAVANHLIGCWSALYRRRKRYKLLMERVDCPFTGVCYDENFIDPVKSYVTDPKSNERGYDLKYIAERCVDAVVDSVRKEIEYHLSDEGIIEYCKSNDVHFEFDEEGNLL